MWLFVALSILVIAPPAAAQLIGDDTAPGSSCVGFAAGATRMTADADLDGAQVVLICDGNIWQSAASAGLPSCNTGDYIIMTGSGWGCSSDSDITPDAFSFTDQTGVAISTLATSNIVQISGINVSTPLSISGDGNPTYRVCGDASCSTVVADWSDGNGMVMNNLFLQMRLTSSASNSMMNSATMTVGTVSDQWDVTTEMEALPGLIGWWKLDETSGSSIADSAGSHTGTWQDGVNNDVADETTAGKIGNALLFDGSNDAINLADNAIWTLSSGKTLSYAAWIQLTSLPSGSQWPSIIQANQGGGNGYGFQLNGASGSQVEVVWWDNVTDYISPPQTLSTSTWYHVAVTIQMGVSNGSNWWLNGQNLGSFTAANTSQNPSSMYIGGIPSGFAQFNGKIDELQLYNRALSGAEVQQLYQAGGT
jgi:hypothetical protein